MKSTFKEYHRYTEEESKALWKNCLFVFDTNTLLNMYRYSRETVDIYFKVLTKLKDNKQLWIPYQVGYEFYENRISVISEYEKSYDEILSVLENVKSDIEIKYKDHPFLDLKNINKKVKEGLSSTETAIKKAKKKHPKWLENDEVLEKINELFKGNIGKNYDKIKLGEIEKEGAERYDKRIPPGFKDNKKDENNKFGDLILWYQIIDKAKKSKKPIVFISGDIKEDWWLKKNGKRLMPLPQLKKEMYEKASVDFHIYTADRFLRLSETDETKIDESTIKEVRKIRELEERRMTMRERQLMEREREMNLRNHEKYSVEYIRLFEKFTILFAKINDSEIHLKYKNKLNDLFQEMRILRNRAVHDEFDRRFFEIFRRYAVQVAYILKIIVRLVDTDPRLSMSIRAFIDMLEDINYKSRRYL